MWLEHHVLGVLLLQVEREILKLTYSNSNKAITIFHDNVYFDATLVEEGNGTDVTTVGVLLSQVEREKQEQAAIRKKAKFIAQQSSTFWAKAQRVVATKVCLFFNDSCSAWGL